jgi:hypothetical protein
MAFKKHNWFKFGSEEKIIEILIKESDGKRLDFFRCNNKMDFKKIVKIIRDKYGFDFSSEKRRENETFFEN